METSKSKLDDGTQMIKNVVKHPLVQSAIFTSVIVALMYVAGRLMRILQTVVLQFKGLSAALQAQVVAPKVSA